MAEVLPVSLPPVEAIEYFRRKGYEISFDWRDVYAQEHARVFTVAKAARLDVLTDIREAVDAAIAEGKTLEQFQRELEPLLQEKGWWGRQQMVDPDSGEEREVQLGSPRRLETIYDTNLRTSYSSGRWQQIERTKARRPYLRYVAVLDSGTRPQHRAWHGTVLPADHPWWDAHFPPNGWRCRCSVQQLSDRDLERFGYQPSPDSPPGGMREWVNPRTGEVRQVPVGVDPGFDYHVGRAGADQARALLEEKIERTRKVAPDIAEAAERDLSESEG